MLFGNAGDETPSELVVPHAAPTGIPAENERGARLRQAITTTDYLPKDREDEILSALMQRPIGSTQLLGFLAGWITGVDTREVEINAGKKEARKLEVIALLGQFEATIGLTGEVISAPMAYMPRAIGQSAREQLKTVPRLDLDLDVMLMKTGRVIAYQWELVNHIQGDAEVRLSEFRRRQGKRLSKLGPQALAGLLQIAKGAPDGLPAWNEPAK
jgi:hypothetical protein